MVDRFCFVAVFIIFFSIPLYLIYGKDFLIPYATLLAVLVALFREKLINYLFHPIIKISLGDEPDHFAIVEARDRKSGQFVDYHVSIGVVVTNVGNGKANNVELNFNGLESNVVQSFERYCSIPMLRSWVGGTKITSLPKNVPIRFDVGFIASKSAKTFNFNSAGNPNALRNINCAIQKISSFKFQVKAISDNATVSKAVIKIDYDCNWKDGIEISLL